MNQWRQRRLLHGSTLHSPVILMMVSHEKFCRRSAMMHVALKTNIGYKQILD
jgi:hypothetical protein